MRISFANWLKVQQIDPTRISPEELSIWKGHYEDAMARAAAGPHVDDFKHEYFRTALEYYISARFAALSFFIPMAGVLFRDAIELYLKGLLCLHLDEGERRELWHDLVEAWTEAKKFIGDDSLSGFDQLVAGLDKYWGVRYPDEIVKEGIMANITFVRGPVAPPSGRREPYYVLTVDELDEFTAMLWKKSGLNIKAFMPMKAEAREYLERWNNWIFW